MAENQLVVKTRAMTGVHCMENDAEHQQIQTNPEIVPDQTHHPYNTDIESPVQNPTVQLTRRIHQKTQ